MRYILTAILCLLLAGCSHIGLNHTSGIEDCADRIAKCIGKGLEDSYMGVSIMVSTPVHAVTFAPSDFGLALQELMISSMVRQKANVIDVQLRREPYITCEEGMISLSRDASRLKGEFRAEVIIASTYVVRQEELIISTRAIDFTTNDVITSTTTLLRISPLVADLLGGVRHERIYER